jgi:hypothetical protein
MRRKIQLALVAGAIAVSVVPATQAQASTICQSDEPAVKVVCTAYYFAGGLVCRLTGGILAC